MLVVSRPSNVYITKEAAELVKIGPTLIPSSKKSKQFNLPNVAII